MGKKWPVQMNLPFFAVEAYVPGGGGVQNQAEKNSKKCLPAGTGTKIYFSRKRVFLEGGFCKMYASRGCGALSAKCTAGANILGYFSFLGRDTGLYRNPHC